MESAPFDWQPLVLTLEVAAAATLGAFVLGTLVGRFMQRRSFAGQDVLEAIFLLPLVLPPVVVGYALLLVIGRQGPVGRWWETWLHRDLLFTPTAAELASLVVAFPLMYQSARAAFGFVDAQLEDAARGLGTPEWRVFTGITLPLAWPGLLAGLLLSFARASGEFGATIMVAGNIAGRTTTASVAIYTATEGGDFATAGRYVLLMALANFLVLLGLNIYSRRARRRFGPRVRRRAPDSQKAPASSY